MQFTCVYFCTKAIYPAALEKKKKKALSGTFLGAECFSSKEGPNGSWCRAAWWGVCPSAQHVRERAGVGSGSEEGLALIVISGCEGVCLCAAPCGTV